MAELEDMIAVALGERDALLEWALWVRAMYRRGYVDGDELAAAERHIEQARRGCEQHLAILRRQRGEFNER